MPAFSQQITVNADDVRHDSAHSFADDTLIRAGESGGSLWHGSAVRFTLTGVPKNTTISNAKITLQAIVAESGTVCRARINANAADDPAQITTDGEWDTAIASVTSAFVDWVVPTVATNEVIDTPDITDVIQEIVDRAGWAPGNHIILFVDDSVGQNSDTDAQRLFDSVTTASPNPATLSFDYTAIGDEPELIAVTNRHLITPGRVRMM